MTDQTTTPPAGDNAKLESAHEIEALLGALSPAQSVAFAIPVGAGKNYRIHTRALRFAAFALREHQQRQDAVREALAVQGPTDINTIQVRNISRLVAELVDTNWPSIDLAVRNIKADSLIAVLRAGLASVVGDATPDSIDEKPAPEPDPAEAPSPSAGPAAAVDQLAELAAYLETWRSGLDGRRFPYAALLPADGPGGYVTGSDVPKPAYISVAALTMLMRVASQSPMPASPVVDASNVDEVDAGERLREGLQGVARLFGVEPPAPEYSSDNPVRQAVYDVLSKGQGEPVPDLVRDVTVAALDSASGVVRSALRHPKVTPLVVLDGADVPAHRLPDLADAYRRSTADAAADELRILARSDEVR